MGTSCEQRSQMPTTHSDAMPSSNGAFLAPLLFPSTKATRGPLWKDARCRHVVKRLPLQTPRRVRCTERKITASSSVNGTARDDAASSDDDGGGNEASQGSSNRSLSATRQKDPATIKKRLLKVLTALINLDSQRGKIEQLILQLEALKATPATEAFTELALGGDWVLLFSSMTTRTEGNVRLREIGQTINTQDKELVNRVVWTYESRDGAYRFMADLLVSCSYKFVGPGRLEITLGDHRIKVKDNGPSETKVPPGDEMKAIVHELQRALPIDFFDPSGLVDISYLEPSFRISKFIGKRMAGVRNVFVRRGEQMSNI